MLNREIRERSKTFLGETSLHIDPHLLRGGLLRRAVWFIIGIISYSILIYAIYSLVNEYRQSPTQYSETKGECLSKSMVSYDVVNAIVWAL